MIPKCHGYSGNRKRLVRLVEGKLNAAKAKNHFFFSANLGDKGMSPASSGRIRNLNQIVPRCDDLAIVHCNPLSGELSQKKITHFVIGLFIRKKVGVEAMLLLRREIGGQWEHYGTNL